MKHRSIFISDIHLGSGNAKAEELLDFLKKNECERLYLVGDIIDGWKVIQNKWRWSKSHTKVIQYLLKLSLAGNTQITYITGNHDEFLRNIVPHEIGIGSMSLTNRAVHIAADGKKYLVIHGDMFDGIIKISRWLEFTGDHMYDFVLWLNKYFNRLRRIMGMEYWSLSAWLKFRIKKAVSYVLEFEQNLAAYCKRKGYDGCICGHIHHPEIREIDGVMYMNDGDWVESCSALVENFNGKFELVFWHERVLQALGDR